MALVFDIETVGESWESFDETTVAALSQWVERASRNDEERERLLLQLKDGLGFSPATGAIVSIALFDTVRREGAVYVDGGETHDDWREGSFTYRLRSEREMLEEFWEGLAEYAVIATFNGRSFDMPFLIHRSIAHGLQVDASFMRQRYLSRQTEHFHVDLLDELTFYGAMARKPNLHLFCRLYGIESPKSDVSGHDVAALYAAGEYERIARYNARDVEATAELYALWRKFLAHEDWQNID
jgi:DNA polymerase elongation subunit (family B)